MIKGVSDQVGGCVDRIFNLRQICEKVREEKQMAYVGFMNLEKVYERVNEETLWHVGDKLLK